MAFTSSYPSCRRHFGRTRVTSRPTIFLQQFVRVEQVVLVILLQNIQLGRLGERTEVHGRGIDGSGDVHESQERFPGRQVKLAHVAHEGKIRVVDSEREVGLIRKRGCNVSVGSRCGSLACGTCRYRAVQERQHDQQRCESGGG